MSETVTLKLDREQAEHLFGRCTESTNAPKINGYSCEDCRAIGTALRAALDGEEAEERVEQLYDGSFELEFLRPGERISAVPDGSGDAFIRGDSGELRVPKGAYVVRSPNGSLTTRTDLPDSEETE